jgi:hypothetical protein
VAEFVDEDDGREADGEQEEVPETFENAEHAEMIAGCGAAVRRCG